MSDNMIVLYYNVPRGACPVLDTGLFCFAKSEIIHITSVKFYSKGLFNECNGTLIKQTDVGGKLMCVERECKIDYRKLR